MASVGRMMSHFLRRKIFKYSLGFRCLNSTLITHSFCLHQITTSPTPSSRLPNLRMAPSRKVESPSVTHDATLPCHLFLSKPYRDGSDKPHSACYSSRETVLR